MILSFVKCINVFLEHNLFCNTQYWSIVGHRWAIPSMDHLFQNPSIPQNITHLLAKSIKRTLKMVKLGEKLNTSYSWMERYTDFIVSVIPIIDLKIIVGFMDVKEALISFYDHCFCGKMLR